MPRRLLVLMVSLLVGACGGEGAAVVPDGGEAEADAPYNVVLIVMDTTRADHIGAYGYPVDTTPNVDAVARHGTLYRNAVSTAPWTLPSHASMFSGLAPHEHGAFTQWVDELRNNRVPLPGDVPVIAEALQEAGYRTAGFAANNVFLKPRWGVRRGFQDYVSRHAYAPEHTRKVKHWLREEAEEPFFLFVNYIDSHAPYNTEPRPGLIPRPIHPDGRQIDQLKREVMAGDGSVPEALRQRVIDQYDTGLAHMDEGIGELLVELDRLGYRDRSIVIITSDHGEYFGEHQLVEHHKDVYQGGVHVPLIVDSPGEKEGVDHTVVTSQHVPWLIRERMNDPAIREVLAPFARSPEETPALVENYYSDAWDVFNEHWGHRFRRIRRGLYDWPYKLIHSTDGAHELYDLGADPEELRDLAGADAERVRAMGATVEDAVGDAREDGEAAELSDLEIEQMRALGYMQ